MNLNRTLETALTITRQVVRVVWLIFYTVYFGWLFWEPIAYIQWRLRPNWGYHSGFGFFSGRGRVRALLTWARDRLSGSGAKDLARDVVAHIGGRPTLRGGITVSLFNAFTNRLFSGLGVSLWLKASMRKRFDDWIAEEKATQDIVPARIFDTVDGVLRSLSGERCSANTSKVDEDEFNYYIGVTYDPHNFNPNQIESMMTAIDDHLSQVGHAGASLVMAPIRIKVPKLEQAFITLADLWPDVMLAPINERLALIGSSGKPVYLSITGEQSGGLIAGRPGAGKSQMALSIILSLCMTNSPETLRVVIVDTKQADFPLLAGLPHVRIVTDAEVAAGVILRTVSEMESRRGQSSSEQQAILLYVDEVADLLNELDKEQSEQVVKAFLRLSQLGRSLDILPWLATQRVYAVPADAYGSLGVRIVGRVRNGIDSTAATGVKGSECHLLPGKGSFAIYGATEIEEATRVQGAFVADSKARDYADQLQPFIDSILDRWKVETPEEPSEGAKEAGDPVPEEIGGFPSEMIYHAIRLYLDNALSQNQARKLSRELRGVDMNNNMFKQFKELVVQIASTPLAERLHDRYGEVAT